MRQVVRVSVRETVQAEIIEARTHLDVLARPNLANRSQVPLQLRLEILGRWLAIPPPSLIRFASGERRQAERMSAAFAAYDLVSGPCLRRRVHSVSLLVRLTGDGSQEREY